MAKDKAKQENNSAAYRDYTTAGENRCRKYTFELIFPLVKKQIQRLVSIIAEN